MRKRNADRIVNLCGAGESRVKTLPVELAHKLEGNLAGNSPVEFPTGKFARCLPSNVNCERWCNIMEELLSVIIGKDDPEIRLQRFQPTADITSYLLNRCYHIFGFGVGLGKELRSMREHGSPNDR